VWLTVHRSSMWNKKPTRCHLVLYLFLSISPYKLLNVFRATLCPSSGADNLVVFFACGVVLWLCRRSDPVSCLCVHWEVRSTTIVLHTSQWTHKQLTGSDRLHSHGTTPHVEKKIPLSRQLLKMGTRWPETC